MSAGPLNVTFDYNEDDVFCGACNDYLFRDIPNDDDLVMCQNCVQWYCRDCSENIGLVAGDDGTVGSCPRCEREEFYERYA